jgi:uroporphyrinogen III methyltransferase/synthase
MMLILITTRPENKTGNAIEYGCIKTVNFPLTKIVYTMTPEEIRQEFEKFSPDTLVFTSIVGSSRFLESVSPTDLKSCRIFCIGEMTASPFLSYGLKCNVPSLKTSSGLSTAILEKCENGSRILIARSRYGSPVLTDALSRGNYQLKEIQIYDLEENMNTDLGMALRSDNYFGILITSSMEARILGKLLNSLKIDIQRTALKVFAIGVPTAMTLREIGIVPDQPIGNSDIKNLVGEISRKYC